MVGAIQRQGNDMREDEIEESPLSSSLPGKGYSSPPGAKPTVIQVQVHDTSMFSIVSALAA